MLIQVLKGNSYERNVDQHDLYNKMIKLNKRRTQISHCRFPSEILRLL